MADSLCLAISLVTGPMIMDAVEIARESKRLYPDKPVVIGGWHPSLMGKARHRLADVAIVANNEASRMTRPSGGGCVAKWSRGASCQ